MNRRLPVAPRLSPPQEPTPVGLGVAGKLVRVGLGQRQEQLTVRAPVRDARLLAGAAVFGIGWGLAGYCPGPALAGVGLGNGDLVWLLPALLLGWWLAGRGRRV